MRVFYQPLLNNHASDRVPDDDWPGCTGTEKKILQSLGKPDNAGMGERQRAAVARHIPGNCAITFAKGCKLTPPCPGRAADAVQEHERWPVRVTCCFVAETEIARLHRCGHWHAGLPVLARTDANSPARDGKEKFYI